MPYSSVSITGYNSNPPEDDGTVATSNEVSWSKHKDKLGDPLKTAVEAINTNVGTAFTGIADDIHPVLATLSPGLLHGLTLSNNLTDLTNDIDIAAGVASDDGGNRVMQLSSALTKRLDAAWAVGTGQGGLDTGSIANTTYHIWLIRRSDTGVVDALFSTSATSPTMPTSYDQKRRIGSIIRFGDTIRAFWQDGDLFQFVDDFSSTPSAASWVLTSSNGLPAGVKVQPIISAFVTEGAEAGTTIVKVGDARDTGETSALFVAVVSVPDTNAILFSGGSSGGSVTGGFFTNTSSQFHLEVSGTTETVSFNVHGFIDDRGRSA